MSEETKQKLREAALKRGKKRPHPRQGAKLSEETKMLTMGGLLYEEQQADVVTQCAFENLSFVHSSEEPYQIDAPNLTYRELRHLDSFLPVEDMSNLKVEPIPDADVRKYARLYRYFPTFAEAEV
jgi:hypothetical protein